MPSLKREGAHAGNIVRPLSSTSFLLPVARQERTEKESNKRILENNLLPISVYIPTVISSSSSKSLLISPPDGPKSLNCLKFR